MKPIIQVEHARIVAHYIVCTGYVGHRGFLEALTKAEALHEAGTLAWSAPEMLNLRDSYAKALHAIAPVRLHHLIEGRNEDEGRYAPPFRSSLWVSVPLILLTLALLGAIVALTDLHNRGKGVIAAQSQGHDDRQRLLISQMVPLVAQAESAEPESGNATIARIALLDRIHAVQDLSHTKVMVLDQKTKVEKELRPIIEGFEIVASPFDNASAVGGWLIGMGRGSANAAPGIPEPPAESVVSSDPAAAANSSAPDGVLGNYLAVARQCQEQHDLQLILTGTSGTVGTGTELLGFGQSIARELDTQIYLRCLLGLDRIEGDTSASAQIRHVNGDRSQGPEPTAFPDLNEQDTLIRGLGLLGGALLPFLYGALGAAVYHLRRCLDPNEPNPPFWRAVMRVVLAGFSGVTVAWFWQPNEAGIVQIGSLPVSSFVVAFLLGYGIDAFLTTLDRLVSLTTAAALRLGDKQVSS